MRGAWRFCKRFGLLLTACIGLMGCTTYNHLRPPKPPEDYTPPPKDDTRFSLPVDYPKDTLNSDNLIAPKNNGMGPGGRGGMGGPGMGGPGMMGPGMGGMSATRPGYQ
jgi:hypothetical protein